MVILFKSLLLSFVYTFKNFTCVFCIFLKAACHKDSVISKKGVTTIHDIVSALLSSSSELSHFHFNEALFKPFENLLCLELCDTDIQEQVSMIISNSLRKIQIKIIWWPIIHIVGNLS